MRTAYGILAVVIVVVLLGVFAMQSSKTKAYTTNEGSHDIELTPPSAAYSKYDFKPKQSSNPMDSLSVEALMDSLDNGGE